MDCVRTRPGLCFRGRKPAGHNSPPGQRACQPGFSRPRDLLSVVCCPNSARGTKMCETSSPTMSTIPGYVEKLEPSQHQTLSQCWNRILALV